jgi:hypothetical protein
MPAKSIFLEKGKVARRLGYFRKGLMHHHTFFQTGNHDDLHEKF